MQMSILWLEAGRHHPCKYGCIIRGAFPKLIIYLAVPPHKPTCRMKSQPRQHPEGSTEWCFRWIRGPEPSLFLMKTPSKHTHTHFDSHQLPVRNTLFASINQDRGGDGTWLPHPHPRCATACLCPLGQVLSPFLTAAVLPGDLLQGKALVKNDSCGF